MMQKDIALVERYADYLTQAQRDIWDKMRFEGCFIVSPKDEYFARLVRPDLTVVQNVYPSTICELNGLYVHETLLGDDFYPGSQYQGRIYVAHEPIHLCSVLRMYEASAKANGFKPLRRKSRANNATP